VLGFTISTPRQSVVSTEQMKRVFGRSGPREIALASLAGDASSSSSYASAATILTLFKKGAALAKLLACLFASTNFVTELGMILYLLMDWQFMVGEWIGGLVLVIVMSVLVNLTNPKRLVETARRHEEANGDHMTMVGETLGRRLTDPQARIRVAQNFTMECRCSGKTSPSASSSEGCFRPSCSMHFGRRCS